MLKMELDKAKRKLKSLIKEIDEREAFYKQKERCIEEKEKEKEKEIALQRIYELGKNTINWIRKSKNWKKKLVK